VQTPSLRLSVLDLSPVASGSTGAEALQNTLDLAKLTDRLGYYRYWLAEHHNSPGIASSVPEIMIGHVADVTTHIRVGSGGIMLPNHSSLQVAESFRVLEALHPGRIDLGIGRAPGTDAITAQALRRGKSLQDTFPQQLAELLAFFGGNFPEGHPYRSMLAVPEDAATPQLWMLSSSGYGAQVAAELGMGLAFAHHIHAEPAIASMQLYRKGFEASSYFASPQGILAVAAVCADTDALAEDLASSFDLTRLRIEQGKRGKFPSVAEAKAYPYEAFEQMRIQENRSRFFVGGPERIRSQISDLAAKAGVQEIMVLSMIHDHGARRRSYELIAKAFQLKAK
jgi:luciferase family oxidoreductase group 1